MEEDGRGISLVVHLKEHCDGLAVITLSMEREDCRRIGV